LAALSRAGGAVAVALEKYELVTRGAVAPVFAAGSRFKGSIRNGLNGVVAGFAAGSQFKGSVRNGLNGRSSRVLSAAHGSRDQYGMV
jgi:membrane protease subunit (stomatin/prohibitin family)